jgi:uncharacterized protein (TIGR02145 family)
MSPKFIILVILLINITSAVCLNSCSKKEIVGTLPAVATKALIEVTATTATIEGEVISDGGSPIKSRGVCWSEIEGLVGTEEPNEKAGIGTFTNIINHLTVNTKYYVRAYATNSVGTIYGGSISFITKYPVIFNPNLTYGTVSDIEDNEYKTLSIGTGTKGSQVWMAENLKTTKFNDGTAIPLVTDNSVWIGLSTPAYCWPWNDEEVSKNPYGALYNGYTIATGKLCPTGWHVPTDAEWHQFILFLDPDAILDRIESNLAGGKIKEIGTTHWTQPNIGATNESGFTALPVGHRGNFGDFSSEGLIAVWWSSTENGTDYMWARSVIFEQSFVHRGEGADTKIKGFSVRCLKD